LCSKVLTLRKKTNYLLYGSDMLLEMFVLLLYCFDFPPFSFLRFGSVPVCACLSLNSSSYGSNFVVVELFWVGDVVTEVCVDRFER